MHAGTMLKIRCDTCRFWDTESDPSLDRSGHPDDQQGFCRRNAPKPWLSGLQYEILKHLTILAWHVATKEEQKSEFEDWEDRAHYSMVCWPTTTGDGWCGEHKPKDDV